MNQALLGSGDSDTCDLAHDLEVPSVCHSGLQIQQHIRIIEFKRRPKS